MPAHTGAQSTSWLLPPCAINGVLRGLEFLDGFVRRTKAGRDDQALPGRQRVTMGSKC